MRSLIHTSSEQLPRAVSEIRRVLTPGGMVEASFRSGGPDGFKSGNMVSGPRYVSYIEIPHATKLFGKCGFERVSSYVPNRGTWFSMRGYRPLR